MASTKAEGRCLRKALKYVVWPQKRSRNKDVVAIATVYHLSLLRESGMKKIQSVPQINFIDGKCKQLDISVVDFINSGEKTYKSIEDISKKTASKMLAMLNEYQNKSKPLLIVGYKSN